MTMLQGFEFKYILNFFSNNFGVNNAWDVIRIIVDIGIVSLVIYKVVILVRETRAWQLIKGILFILLAAKVSGYFGLKTLAYILDHAVQYIAIALVVLFQPELRRALEQIGRSKFQSIFLFDESELPQKCSTIVEEVVKSTEELSKTRTGALIVFEKQTKIGEVINSGVCMDANITSQLLLNIFTPNTPLHDGAVVVRNNKIKAAACFLPLTDNQNLSQELGTRHRAAIGMTEVSDCIALIVSEETGKISIAQGGKIERGLSTDAVRKILCEQLSEDETEIKKLHIWKVKSK